MRARLAGRMELLDALARALAQLAHRPELNRIGRTGLGARRLEAGLQPVVAQRALLRRVGNGIDVDHAERTRRYAGAAAVAGIGLNHLSVELGADDGVGRTHLEAACLDAVLAYVAHHEPASVLAVFGELLDELPVAPVDAVEPARIVVAVAAQRVETAIGGRQLVPLLAGDLAGFAANADRGVSVETHGLGHRSLLTPALRPLDVADERLAFVHRYVRIADERRQLVDDVAPGQAFVTPMPRHSHLVD